ncbi:MAG: type VI secretion system baseplate subunit TssK, partial [Bryobacteraceae bacterium]
MKRLQPVIWSKGTFLTPQHLQIQDRFIESTLEFTLSALNYRPWGLRSLSINQEALAGDAFALASASGLFPDGMPFEIPESDPPPPPRPLAQCFEGGQSSLDVYLAI